MNRILFSALAFFVAFSVDADKASSPPEGVDTWPAIIDRNLNVSYEQGQMACIRLYKTDLVEVVDSGGEKRPLDFRYRIKADQRKSKITLQLDAFAGLGILAKSQTQNVTEYRLLAKGWGLSPAKEGFENNICVETGRWHVDKITQYRAVPDPDSGLNSYLVSAEKAYREHEWAERLDKSLFDLKRTLPQVIQNLVLVQGPKGYLMVTANPHSLRPSKPSLPGPDAVEAMIAGDPAFLKSYCNFVRWVVEQKVEECSEIEYLNYASKLRVYYTGVPQGNMTVFKYVDLSDPDAPHLGHGYLELLRNNVFKPRVGSLYQ